MNFERFGKYLLLEKLAAGGMAEVYLAKLSGGFNKFVAIKRILPQFSENTEFLQMFKEEAKIVANLRHSNIVSIHYFGHEKRQLYLVMDFVEGQNLRQTLNVLKKENKQLTIDQIIYLIKEVAAGLDYAHRALDDTTGKPLNIIHRDMSPQNIMISFEGEVKIVDFGIAKAGSNLEQTQAGTIKGKFGYMSPEQADAHELDARTDVFSLGIIMWELISGERLFAASNEALTLKKVRECQIPSLRKIIPELPAELERITLKALSKDLSLRYQSASSFHKDLNRFLNVHYPEFSKQEFSRYMKSVFHEMFIENRKKLASYSQPIDAKEEHTVTLTSTQNETLTGSNTSDNADKEAFIPGLDNPNQSRAASSPAISDIPINQPGSPSPADSLAATVVAKNFTPPKVAPPVNLKIENKSQINSDPYRNFSSVTKSSRINVSPNHTQSRSQSFQNKPNNRFSNLANYVLMLALILGGYWQSDLLLEMAQPLKQYKIVQQIIRLIDAEIAKQSPNTPMVSAPIEVSPSPNLKNPETISAAPVNLQSKPSGATIEANGQQIGITPYLGSLPAEKDITLLFKKNGYISFERTVNLKKTRPFRLEAILQLEPPKGYITIELLGAPNDTIIEINGRRIDDKSQLSLYPVPARVPVEIKAISPFSKAVARTSVQVGINEKKNVKMVIAQPKGN